MESTRVSRGEDKERFLLCRIGSRIGALALRDVWETMRPLPVESLPGSPPFVVGLAIVRGIPTPVVDANRLLGSSTPPGAPDAAPLTSRFVSIKLGERTAVLAVDAVLGVRSLAAEMFANIPPLLQGGSAELASAIGALDAKLLLVLEAARLVPDSLWSAIETPGAAT
jgi:purine-binding chemotaxis protein CheW